MGDRVGSAVVVVGHMYVCVVAVLHTRAVEAAERHTPELSAGGAAVVVARSGGAAVQARVLRSRVLRWDTPVLAVAVAAVQHLQEPTPEQIWSERDDSLQRPVLWRKAPAEVGLSGAGEPAPAQYVVWAEQKPLPLRFVR